MHKLAILGYPISHSLSPEIHTRFATQFNINLSYEKIAVKPAQFEEKIIALQQANYLGVNITLPLKTLAYQFTPKLTPEANLVGAVNTLHLKKMPILGTNTDGLGFIEDLTNNCHFDLKNKNVLLLGAGGAAHGILNPIITQQPKQIYLYNRTVENTQYLMKTIQFPHCKIISQLDELLNLPFDILINSTAQHACFTMLKELPINLSHCFCYDLNYGKFHQSFVDIMHRKHCSNYADGFGMLLTQAALAFEFWFDVKPKINAEILSLREHFQP